MSTETQPIWKDPFARAMGCITATVVSWMLLVEHVTIPYLYIPVARGTFGLFGRFFVEPELILQALMAGPDAIGIVAVVSVLTIAFLLLAVPVFMTAAVPLAVSYWFWMVVVYGWILGEREE